MENLVSRTVYLLEEIDLPAIVQRLYGREYRLGYSTDEYNNEVHHYLVDAGPHPEGSYFDKEASSFLLGLSDSRPHEGALLRALHRDGHIPAGLYFGHVNLEEGEV